MKDDLKKAAPTLHYQNRAAPWRGRRLTLEFKVTLTFVAQVLLGAAAVMACERWRRYIGPINQDWIWAAVLPGLIGHLWVLCKQDGFWRAIGPAIVLTLISVPCIGLLGALISSIW